MGVGGDVDHVEVNERDGVEAQRRVERRGTKDGRRGSKDNNQR